MKYRTQLTINMNNLEYNCNRVLGKLPEGVKLLAVIKANAYGHGAVEFAKFLKSKCDFFGVACIEEAVELRLAGITAPILILGRVFPDSYQDVVKYDIRIPIFSIEDARVLSQESVKQGKNVPFHFCVDTGMSRIGFQINDESADLCKEIVQLPNIEAEGIFSHFATADETDLSRAIRQRERFDAFITMLEDRGISIPIKHINNSAGIMNFDKYYDMCRMGIITYGLYPSEEVDKALLDIKPVMTWQASISHIKTINPGDEVSYGGTFKADKPTRVATIPVGYADGYPRCLSNKGRVIVNGQYANIIGRVCMDQFMVDVTDIECSIGDQATLVGEQGKAKISMEELSNNAHSFNYELPCRIQARVPRLYTYNNRVMATVELNK
ncbi:MAG: alanine racemase [Eubacterium sp.]